MKETCSFSIWRHDTAHPHYDFLLDENGGLRHWIIPSSVPEKHRDKRLAIEEKTAGRPTGRVLEHGINEDSYGTGEAELWDRGTCSLETSKKIKLVLNAVGGKLSGRYLLIIPGWGRWTEKKLWVLEKIRKG